MSYDILRNGAILVGKNFVIDGYYPRQFRVVTHFHADHISGLRKNIKEGSFIIATPITLDVLDVLENPVPKSKRVPLVYDVKLEIDGERIILKRAEHILGSAQVLIKTEEELEIGYTGDFKNPGKGTPILNPDILIIEATYGRPEFKRPFKDEVNYLFSDYVKEKLIYGPVKIYSYYGKLQEAMSVLRENGIIAPFIVRKKVKEITKIAQKYGFNVKDIYSDDDKDEFNEIIRSKWYVEFKHIHELKSEEYDHNSSVFILRGWEFNEPIKRLNDRKFIVALSDHADFDELVYYVSSTSASLIIADNGRKSYAKDFAEYIKKYLNKKAIVLPR